MKQVLLLLIVSLAWKYSYAKEVKCFPVSSGASPPVKKTTMKCPRVPCHNLYIWSEELCKCICPSIRCPPDTVSGNDCDCIPETTQDTTICPEQKCRNRYIWLQEQCQCVCPPMYCPKGTIHGNDCDCIPYTTPGRCEPTTPCNRSWFWNYDTCQCQIGCDFIKECPQGLKWDIFACSCVRACPGVVCEENLVPDSETCECVISSDTTLSVCGQIFCPDNYYLDTYSCECISIDPTDSTPEYCPEQGCKKGYFWMPEPICQCWLVCDYIMICPDGEKWDFEVCNCVVDPDYVPSTTSCPNECYGNNVLNTTTCECECHLTEEDCPGPLAELDFDMCNCLRHPCDPPYPCPKGEIISWEVCNCVPDPDYVPSTTCIATSIPEETTSSPEETTSSPEEMTSSPEEMTSSPEDMITSPEDTTTTE